MNRPPAMKRAASTTNPSTARRPTMAASRMTFHFPMSWTMAEPRRWRFRKSPANGDARTSHEMKTYGRAMAGSPLIQATRGRASGPISREKATATLA